MKAARLRYPGRRGRTIVVASLAAASVAFTVGCGEDAPSEGTAAISGAPNHIHGLGVDPADGALFIATHSGLFRSAPGTEAATRVEDQFQDTMGFTVLGPNRFLGSGHPAPGEDRPPNLGLIESGDAGRNWQEVSLAGEADFHVLRSVKERVYAYNGLTGKLMLSADEGRTWSERTPPGPVIDLAVDPEDPDQFVVTTERGLAITDDGGERWRPISSEIGLLAWPSPDSLFLVDAAGEVQRSEDPERQWSAVGSIGGQPVAFAASSDGDLYAALPDGSVLTSTDGGASWSPRASL